jgi:hypothetical protein
MTQQFNVMQASIMGGGLGDIFWDLPPWITYAAGYDLGCNIYVANPSDTVKEYALMARLSRDTTVISDEAIPVYGYTWFKVEPGDFVTLKGAFRFTESNAGLTLSLVERESGEATDSVVTLLVPPSTSSLPPGWGGTPGTPGTTTTDWSSMLGMMIPMLGFAMLGMVMVSAFRPKEETKKVGPTERMSLPLGRRE